MKRSLPAFLFSRPAVFGSFAMYITHRLRAFFRSSALTESLEVKRGPVIMWNVRKDKSKNLGLKKKPFDRNVNS